MKYLYGNSESFPLQYDFLKTLESFMTAGTRVVQLEAEWAALQREQQQHATSRNVTLDGLEAFHAAAQRVLQDAATRSGQPEAQDYVKALIGQGQHLIDEQRRTAKAANDRDAAAVASKTNERGEGVRSALESFFRTARLPVLGTEISVKVVEHHCELKAAFLHPSGIATTFTLPNDGDWQHLRRVSEFATEVDAKVGVKKKWLRDEISAENERLDEYFLGGLVLSDHQAVIRLRRKPDQPDGLVFKLTRTKGKVSCDVEHPGDPRAESLPTHLDHADATTIDRLCSALSNGLHASLERRERMTSLTLDKTDAIANHLATEVINHLVALFGPTVQEIAKRSPNDHELTLKCESEAGKREELYLRKADLVKKLQPLPAAGRAVFEPLGLSHWVPPVTAPPPHVPAVTTPAAVPPVLLQAAIPTAPQLIIRGVPEEPSSADVTDVTDRAQIFKK
jgi:hypothetical protein